MPLVCAWIPTSWQPWRRLPPRRRPRPGQRGPVRRTKRARGRNQRGAGRATPRPGPAQAPAEGRPAGPFPRRSDQQDPPCRRPQLPPTGVRADRRTGRRHPQFIPVLGKIRIRVGVGRPPHSTRRGRGRYGLLLPRQPRPPAQAPYQGGHPGEGGPGYQPQEEGGGWRSARPPRRRSLQGAQHRRTSDQQTQGLARRRHPLRQDPGQLSGWHPAARLAQDPRRPVPPRRGPVPPTNLLRIASCQPPGERSRPRSDRPGRGMPRAIRSARVGETAASIANASP